MHINRPFFVRLTAVSVIASVVTSKYRNLASRLESSQGDTKYLNGCITKYIDRICVKQVAMEQMMFKYGHLMTEEEREKYYTAIYDN